jgi:Secretion system C-terminal sorting domain
MKKIIHTIFAVLLLLQLPAQNLVTNSDAESLPRGTGWTIVSEGALTCLLSPTDNIVNWTMKPNGTANYPYDHTTGANGGTVFFSGCDTYFTGPFELQQSIDVSADAALIDLGNEVYTFSGYMQTPVNNQTDRGRFIVDFLNAANAVLGTSYTSSWQSFFGGSGTSWVYYNNTRIAPAGTRKITIRMQAEMLFHQPAINVYFDDVSLTKPIILPVSLVSFSGKEMQGTIHLNWTINNELLLKQFELEQSNDATHFNSIATIPAGKTSYHFIDDNNSHTNGTWFYRLKMTGTDGKNAYSNIVMIKITAQVFIRLSPNPANDIVIVNGSFKKGIISVINSSGQTVFTSNKFASPVTLDISRLPAGLYVVRFSDPGNSINKKLVVQHQ